jgi:MraZ protein
MFFGAFEHTIDSKGRLTIPAKFKDPLAGGIVVTRGLDGCLWGFTRQEWQNISEKIASLTLTSVEARRFTRFMFSSASDAIPDRNGRVVIPQKLLEYGSIDREVVVAGVMNKIEIWNPQRWDEEQAQATEDPEALVEQLADLGIL